MKTTSMLGAVLALAMQALSAQPRADTATRIQQLATTITHFATSEFIANRSPDPRAPPELREEHQRLVEGLRQASGDAATLRRLVTSADPATRTLALAALYMREDPHDLPTIAGQLGDGAPTLLRLRNAETSAGGPLPRGMFESSQTVGDVARAMVISYLEASGFDTGRDPAALESMFESYWAERQGRVRTLGWFAFRMRRATRQTSPLQPQYRADIDRVLAEINALPSDERAWTLLFVRTGVSLSRGDDLIPDRQLIDALRGVGRATVLSFLDGLPPIDDPDLTHHAGDSWRGLPMIHVVLRLATNLLTSDDADRVRQGAERFSRVQGPDTWIVASARLRALADSQRAGDELKAALAQSDAKHDRTGQAALVATLWQVRGTAERDFVTNWIYTAPSWPLGNEAVSDFFRNVESDAQPNTRELVAAMVSDRRFDEASWFVLAPLLAAANRMSTVPVVSTAEIYNNQPRPPRADHAEVLARWRTALRTYVAR